MRIFLKFYILAFKLEKIFNPVNKGEGKRILIIVIGGLGDCLLFDSLFRRLKEKWPDSQIDVLTGCFEDMWERLDSIDNLIYFSPLKFKPPWKYFSLFRIINRKEYDIVAEGIIMVPMKGIYPIFTSLIFKASMAPVRIGRNSVGRLAALRPKQLGFISREDMAGMKTSGNKKEVNQYITHTIDILPPDRRNYHESMKIFEPIGIFCHRNKNEPVLKPDPDLAKWSKKMIRAKWADDDVIVGFTVETTRMIKLWPFENFVSILEAGIKDNMKFIMIGLDANIAAKFPVDRFDPKHLLNLSGMTSLGEMIAVISQCNIFLSCDCGPSHIAQACRIPSIVLFGPSNENEFGPVDNEMHSLILPPEDLKCRPCVLGPCIREKSCVHSISVKSVYEDLLRKSERFKCRPSQSTMYTLGNQPNVLYSM